MQDWPSIHQVWHRCVDTFSVLETAWWATLSMTHRCVDTLSVLDTAWWATLSMTHYKRIHSSLAADVYF